MSKSEKKNLVWWKTETGNHVSVGIFIVGTVSVSEKCAEIQLRLQKRFEPIVRQNFIKVASCLANPHIALLHFVLNSIV